MSRLSDAVANAIRKEKITRTTDQVVIRQHRAERTRARRQATQVRSNIARKEFGR